VFIYKATAFIKANSGL